MAIKGLTFPKTNKFAYFLISVTLIIYGLIVAKDFLYPITFGILLSYLLYPITNFFEKKNFPRIAAILISIILGAVIVTAIAILVIKRISSFTENLPEFREKVIYSIQILEERLKNTFGLSDKFLKNFINPNTVNDVLKVENIFSATTGTLFKILMQPVYIFLFLYYRTKMAYFILKITGRENRLTVLKILREISTVVTRYMLGVTTVVIILCFINSAGLFLVGIKYPMLLGILSALFSYIPYFGNFIGATIPFLFALITEDSYTYPVRVIIYAFVIHFIENNILSPNIVGNNVRISPLFIIIGLILAATIWGLPGMLVVIPFLAMFNIAIKHVPSLHPYSYLLSTQGTKRHALTAKNLKKWFLFEKK